MEIIRFRPLIDRLYYLPLLFTALVLTPLTVLTALAEPMMLAFTIPTDLFCLYFFISPLFGLVELRENAIFIRYGFFLRREIPYASIRGTRRARGLYGESMLSLKSGMEHLHILYDRYGITTVSVKDNDRLALEIEKRLPQALK